MNRKHKKRILVIITFILLLGGTLALILYALKQNINLFYTPTQLQAATKINPEQNLRLGGYVKKGSLHYDNSGTEVYFVITDGTTEIKIRYQGVLPSLFREGQGVVVTGKLIDALELKAEEVLAKHDEKYMPLPLKQPSAITSVASIKNLTVSTT